MTDKAAHFLGGVIVSMLCYPLGLTGVVLSVLAAAAIKEAYDKLSGKGEVDVGDVVSTLGGGFAVIVPAQALGEFDNAYLAGLWAAWLLWVLYVVMMGMYRAYLAKRLGPVLLVLGGPFVLLGLVLDFLAQMTVANIVFREFPPVREIRFFQFRQRMVEPLVTHRLQRHMAGPDGWRKERARWICTHMLDPIDPTGAHCD